MCDFKKESIKEITFGETFRKALIQEFNDLLLFLHRDDSTGDLDRMTERFLGKAIAYSLPTWAAFKDIINTKGDILPVDRIALIFNIEKGRGKKESLEDLLIRGICWGEFDFPKDGFSLTEIKEKVKTRIAELLKSKDEG